MKKILDKLCSIWEKFSVAYLALLFLAVLIQIILRNIFNKGSAPIEEFSRYCNVSLVFLMVPVLAFRNGHIVVDMIVNRLSAFLQKVAAIFSSLLCSSLMFFLLYSITKIMERNWNVRTPGMRMLNAVYYISITAGVVLAFVVFVYQLVSEIFTKKVEK